MIKRHRDKRQIVDKSVVLSDKERRAALVRVGGLDVWTRTEKRGDLDVVREVIGGDCYGLRRTARTPPERILDVGAHVGSFSLLCRSLWPDSEIVCVEPNARSLELLEMNLRRDPKTRVVRAAVGAETTTARLTDHDGATGGGSVVGDDWRSGGGYVKLPYPVRVLSLSDLLKEARFTGETLPLVKWDCEGGEIGAFSTATPESVALFGDMVGEYHCSGGVSEFAALATTTFPDHDWSFPSSGGPIGYFFAKKQ